MASLEDFDLKNRDDLSNISEPSDKENEDMNLQVYVEQFLENLEKEMFRLQSEIRKKDLEIEQQMEKLEAKNRLDHEIQAVIESLQDKILTLHHKVKGLEILLNAEKREKDNCLKALQGLESENKKLKDENIRIHTEIFNLTSIIKTNHLSKCRTRANSIDFSEASCTSPCKLTHNESIMKSNNSEFSMTISDLSSFVKSDEIWINKINLLKEKIWNEQNRCKDFELMLGTQKNLMKIANEDTEKLKNQNNEKDNRIEKLLSEIKELSNFKDMNKNRIQNVIQFCEMIAHCEFSTLEFIETMSEFPFMISSYLKGECNNMSFDKKQSSSNNLIMTAERIKKILKIVEEEEQESDAFMNELKEMKSALIDISKVLPKALPVHRHRESLNSSHVCKGTQHPDTNDCNCSVFVARAVYKSHKLISNLHPHKSHHEDDEENLKSHSHQEV